MRISTAQIYARNINALLKNQEKVSDIQNKIAAGKNVITPSDDPVSASRILALENEKSISQTFKKGIDYANGRLDLMESTMQSVSQAVMRAKQLTIQSNSSALSFHDRINISFELDEITNTLVDLGNAKDSTGNYLFSGSKVSNPAVIKNSQDRYIFNGDESQRYVQLGYSQKVAISDSLKQIFFDVDTATLASNSFTSVAEISVVSPGLQNTGSLTVLDGGDLIINDIDIPAATTDNISNQSSARSALAIVNAINSKFFEHQVLAQVNTNSVNLGTPTLGILVAGDFVINDRAITGNFTTNQQLVDAINLETITSGVTAADNAGQIILTSKDGRNVHLTTDGSTAGATFANYNLNGGSALDQVQRAPYTLRSHTDIKVDGAAVSDVGLNLGLTNVTINSGTASINSLKVVSAPAKVPESYIIKFNPLNPSMNYSIYNASNPNIPIAGYDSKTYVADETISIDGTSFQLKGAPAVGDSFIINIDNPAKQDIFTSMNLLMLAVKNDGLPSSELAYLLDNAIQNLDYFENKVLEARAKLGARMNVVQNSKISNDNLQFINATNLSLLQDLDYAKAISEFSKSELILDAAQKSFAKIQELNLFNYLK